MTFSIPEGLDHLRSAPGGAEWLARLPDLVASCVTRWQLTLGAPFPNTHVSYAAPVRAAQDDAVLKVPFPHRESRHEAAALQMWAGQGAVRLLDHDSATGAMLLERCVPGTPLSAAPPEEALDVIAGLLPDLWRPAADPFDRLADEAVRWAEGLPHAWEAAGRPCPRRLVDAAVEAFEFLGATQTEQVLVNQDLHAGNVLRSQRRPWLVIDPKPLVGERAFSAAPVVRGPELGGERAAVAHRLDRLSEELDLDRERLRLWAAAHTMAWSFEGDAGLPGHHRTAAWLLAM